HRGDHAVLRVQDRAPGRAGQRRARDGEHRAHGRQGAPDPNHPHADYRGWPAGAHEASMALILKRASASRTSGEWREDRLTPSWEGTPLPRTVGMIAESLTLKPGIREHNRRQSGRGLSDGVRSPPPPRSITSHSANPVPF